MAAGPDRYGAPSRKETAWSSDSPFWVLAAAWGMAGDLALSDLLILTALDLERHQS
jgi:hypothetical protein